CGIRSLERSTPPPIDPYQQSSAAQPRQIKRPQKSPACAGLVVMTACLPALALQPVAELDGQLVHTACHGSRAARSIARGGRRLCTEQLLAQQHIAATPVLANQAGAQSHHGLAAAGAI